MAWGKVVIPERVRRFTIWAEYAQCHCGYFSLTERGVCPMCGCSPMSKVIARQEWDHFSGSDWLSDGDKELVLWTGCSK